MMPLEAVIAQDGFEGLDRLPGIGRGIASAIMEMVSTGRWVHLDRVKGALEPEQLFQTLPGIGPELATKIHDDLHVDTLEALELAAHDGRLEAVAGIGPRRAEAIRMALNDRLGRRIRRQSAGQTRHPPVDLLLDIDRDYREKAEAGTLRTIAPKRFNPTGDSWLPILHTQRGAWQATALYSNTQKAHDLGKTRDWVAIYSQTDHEPEAQCTVVTETHGSLAGYRVVRGRERECSAHYKSAIGRRRGAGDRDGSSHK